MIQLSPNASLFWYLVAAAAFVLMILIARSAHQERFRLSFTLLLLGLGTAQLLGLIDAPALAALHWRWLAFCCAIYLLLGFPYVYLYEWDRFLTEEYLRRREYLSQLPPEAAEEHPFSEPIKARCHKGKIVGWLVWWPVMLIYTVLIRWVLNLAEHILDLWRRVYESAVHLFQEKSNRKHRSIVKTQHSV